LFNIVRLPPFYTFVADSDSGLAAILFNVHAQSIFSKLRYAIRSRSYVPTRKLVVEICNVASGSLSLRITVKAVFPMLARGAASPRVCSR
jgi:hypothetical protein